MFVIRLRASVPYVIAAVIAANGFLNLAAGLAEIFHLSFYLEMELDEVSRYIQTSPSLKVGGFVSVGLGTMLIALGKGLAERRRRAWWWTVGVLGALLINHLFQSLPLTATWLSVLLLVMLLIFRSEFNRSIEPRKWSYVELIAAISVLFALAYGIVGSYLLRHEFDTIASWIDAVYFTIVTYSTLGYGDILPLTPNARIFTISMVFIGLSSFVTALTVLLGPMIERRMKGVFSVMSKFQKSVDHVVVCGFTNVTESIVDELRERGIPFLLIEERDQLVLHLKSMGYDVVAGDPAEKDVLDQANVCGAAALIAATDSDAANTLIALTARQMRDEHEDCRFRIIVRIEAEENIAKVQRIGVDEVISPSTLAGRLMATKAVGADSPAG